MLGFPGERLGLPSLLVPTAPGQLLERRQRRPAVEQGYKQLITPSADPAQVVYNESLLVAFDHALAMLSDRNIKVPRQGFLGA